MLVVRSSDKSDLNCLLLSILLLFVPSLLSCTEIDADNDGYTLDMGDCDDENPNVHPGHTELCDGVDNNCNTEIDDSEDCQDVDNDGFRPIDGDCDDSNPGIHPDAEEICDGIDQNCDEILDENTDCYDDDGDGFSENEGDCDDVDPSISPSQTEVPGNGVDENCDYSDLSTISLSDSDAQYSGIVGYWHSGLSAASCGDHNNDGFSDVIFCAPNDATEYQDDPDGTLPNPGHCYIFNGPTTGTWNNDDASAILVGEEVNDNAGFSVSTAGDINQDGFDDILVGAWASDEEYTLGGRAYIVFGPLSGETELANADVVFTAESTDAFSGYSVASLPQGDSDPPATVVGAPRPVVTKPVPGRVYVYWVPQVGVNPLSESDVVLTGEHGLDRAGESVASAGDVNGDGAVDLLVGAPENDTNGDNAGRVYLFYEIIGPTVSMGDADAIFTGEQQGDFAGISVAGAGDVDGDGNDDILIGAYLNSDAGERSGKVYLLNGPQNGEVVLDESDFAFVPESHHEMAGYSVSSGGDYNGDGYSDFAIGVPGDMYWQSHFGKVYVFLGPIEDSMEPMDADIVFSGEHHVDWAGIVDFVDDTNGDGYDDLLIGAPYNSQNGIEAGKTYLVLGYD